MSGRVLGDDPSNLQADGEVGQTPEARNGGTPSSQTLIFQ